MFDLLIKNAAILSMDQKKSVIKDGFIGIEKDSISMIGPMPALDGHQARVIIDASGQVAMPSFINTHLHIGYSLLKGIASDITERLAWLSAVYPYVNLATPDDCYAAAMLCCLEMIKGGVTGFIENNPFITDRLNTDAIAQAVRDSGMRAGIGRMFSDTNAPDFLLMNAGEMKKEIKRLYDTWHGKANGRINIWIYAPGPGIRESPPRMAQLLKIAKDYGLRISSHWAEAADTGRTNYYTEHFGAEPPTRFLLDQGYLGPDTLLVHVVTVNDEEVKMLADTGTQISHCPTSNSIIPRQPMEISPVSRMLNLGIKVGLGTDASICNDRTSMLEAMKDACLFQKVRMGDPRALIAEQALAMATTNGAQVLGMAGNLGVIAPGYKADIVLMDIWKPHIQPVHNIYENIVYCAQDSDIETVIIDGQVVMQNRVVKTMDEAEVMSRAVSLTKKLDGKSRRKAGEISRLWQTSYKRRFQGVKRKT